MSSGVTDEAAVRAVLAEFKDPETGRSIVQMDQVHGMSLADNRLSVTLGLTTHSAPLWNEAQQELTQLLRSRLPGLKDVSVVLAVHQRPPLRAGEMG